jgi:hypothetical protein
MIEFINTVLYKHSEVQSIECYRSFTQFQVTVAHALGFSISTSRFLATDLNTETSTSYHYEVFLSSVTLYSSVQICPQLIFPIR